MNYILFLGCIVLALILFHPNKSSSSLTGKVRDGVWKNASGVSGYITDAFHDATEKENDRRKENSTPSDYTPYVYLTISHNQTVIGDIIIRLYDIDLPKTTTNFRKICTSKKYNGTPFHRIIKGFMIQGGDNTNQDGTGGTSIYGSDFEDEGFLYKNTYGSISMANGGPNTNGSQFFVNTCKPGNHHLDSKHVVFGEVVHGIDIVAYIESTGKSESESDTQENPPQITDSGEIWMED